MSVLIENQSEPATNGVESMFAEVLRRDGDRWITEIIQGPAATLSLTCVPLTVAMAELYDGVPLPEPRVEPGRARP